MSDAAGGAERAVRRPASDSATLSELEQGVLDFERAWWRSAGTKEEAIRNSFGISGTRYYQILNQLLESPIALAQDPILIKRLIRIRDRRIANRRVGRSASRVMGDLPDADQKVTDV